MTMSLGGLLMKIVHLNPGPRERPGMTYIVVRRPYAYLEEELRVAFEGQDDVKVIVDKRHAERRTSEQPPPAERRHADRRRVKEELMEVLMVDAA